ncbi:4'-phosphopantetheinyl transferase family protein [Haliangium ochraceum]|uniref:4'-phosphopantetheinyl transferase n=1 Tax=Haliangium ochraceum (strain DSM 14365 / JCM 11303 / SMP-2) TaxID=502025 RepID=D0LMF9_HALO1|nr:4'-phosphopantetheinyl transferase superfamily protein [Haliangium ochraceum]ACY16865.1 4'-phosphopantetheinyl transferase [Haliangium ochraceum DSM 14365]
MQDDSAAPERASDARVDIWEVAPEALTPAQRERCLTLLDDAERERHARFVFERDRVLYRVAHAMVREVLGRYLGGAALRFAAGPWGRPELAGAEPAPLRFNLSHTHGLAALVITRSADCGVDVEAVDRIRDPLALADSVFAPAERAALRAEAPARQNERFFAYWTLKEAYIKARGMGLSLPLEQFAFTLAGAADAGAADAGDGYQGARIEFAPGFEDPGGPWWFRRWHSSPRHRGAVAVRGVEAPVLRRRVWPGPG